MQTATRAMRDGADEELIVCALFHDVGETLGPLNHGEVGAAILRPFISEQNHWVLAHHAIFQTYFYARIWASTPMPATSTGTARTYQACVDFTTNWDEVSFDPGYPSEPLSTFEPMVRSVLSRPWAPPAHLRARALQIGDAGRNLRSWLASAPSPVACVTGPTTSCH